ncbi:unnamed protein product, partial [Laminaria digitata]
ARGPGPTVHVTCAQNMFKARAERAQHKLRGLREQAVEEAIRLGGYQTLPLGRDRHGRFYYRFPGDSRRVFVSRAFREGDEGSEDALAATARLSAAAAATTDAGGVG